MLPNFTEDSLLYHLKWICESNISVTDAVVDIMRGNCSDKTMSRISRITEYFTSNSAYQALYADAEVFQKICVLSRSLSFTIQENIAFVKKRSEALSSRDFIMDCTESQFKKVR